MLSRCRFLLSLVAALLLSTLASANSAPVSATFLHSSASVYGGAGTYPGSSLITEGKASPTMSAAFNNPTSVENRKPLSGSAMLGKDITDYNATRFIFAGVAHGTIAHKHGDFAVWHGGSPVATPEPGSLMLLSTGLLGIAGLIRRKLRG